GDSAVTIPAFQGEGQGFKSNREKINPHVGAESGLSKRVVALGLVGSQCRVENQDPSKLGQKKRNAIELEPKTFIVDLHYNRQVPKGVKFLENKVIEEHRFGLFLIDEFGDQPSKELVTSSWLRPLHCWDIK
ncbi:hypothetical protein Tco_1550630, partial [Tanacetum coccineum]